MFCGYFITGEINCTVLQYGFKYHSGNLTDGQDNHNEHELVTRPLPASMSIHSVSLPYRKLILYCGTKSTILFICRYDGTEDRELHATSGE